MGGPARPILTGVSRRIDKSWVVLRRRDVEDAGAWTPVAYHSGAAYSSDDALSAAVKAVVWLGGALKAR